jgi:protein-disulfide isomerase
MAGALALMLMAAPVAGQELDEAEVKRLALEAIRENPEIVMEAVEILRQREEAAVADAAASVLEERRDALERDPNAPVMGAAEGDVTVVEFFDYNCPYCRRAAPELEALIEADEGVRVVMREWPILGEGSEFAARAALASRGQGLYEPFHWALMELSGRAEEDTVIEAAREVGLDVDRLRVDMEASEVEEHIALSMELAEGLGFSGTPSFVVGDALVPGLVPREDLEDLIAEAREAE